MRLKTIIVDDEEMHRSTLLQMLGQSADVVEVVAAVGTVEEAIQAIGLHDPHLVMLDVQLRERTGFEVIAAFPLPKFKVIFCTAHSHYAIQAIRCSALDYLLKPFTQVEVALALQKAMHTIGHTQADPRLPLLTEQLKPKNARYGKLALQTQKGFDVIDLETVAYLEADRSYTLFHFTNKSSTLVSRPLKYYAEILEDQQFFRSHQSFLLNLDMVLGFEKRKKGGIVKMKNGIEIPIVERLITDFKMAFLRHIPQGK